MQPISTRTIALYMKKTVHFIQLQFTLIETVVSAICDEYPKLHGKKTLVTLIVCTINFFLGLPYCARVSMQWKERSKENGIFVTNNHNTNINNIDIIFNG